MASLLSVFALAAFRRLLPVALPGALLFLLSACHQEIKDPHDPRFIVAEAQNWVILRGQLDTETRDDLKQMHKTVQDVPPAQLPLVEAQILKGMVLKKLIFARADALHINVDKEDAATFTALKGQFPSDAEFRAKLEQAGLTEDSLRANIHEKDIFNQTLVKDTSKSIDPSDAEVNAFYEENKDKLTIPEKMRASRILLMADDKMTPAARAAKKKLADKAHARVQKGEDFGKVAAEVSEDQYSKTKGGDVGYFQRGENEPAFDQVAFAMKDGETSPVFLTSTGYEFIRITNIQPQGVLPVSQVRDKIFSHLQNIKRSQAADAYFKKLMADNHVTMHLVPVKPDQLPGAPAAESTNAPSAAPH